MKYHSIAVDGPSGAGKSTLAKMLAKELGFLYVDTGAIYRTVGLKACRAGIEPTDAASVNALLPALEIRLAYGEDGLQHMFLNGEDVTEAIRRHEISHYASAVSAIPEVRAYLLDLQRQMAAQQDVIMDGRDIGTVVLPDAEVKIFLTATPEDRARRRHMELLARGEKTDYETVFADMKIRDANDSSRAAAPLKCAEDAVEVDTTGNTLEESFQVLSHLIRERLGL